FNETCLPSRQADSTMFMYDRCTRSRSDGEDTGRGPPLQPCSIVIANSAREARTCLGITAIAISSPNPTTHPHPRQSGGGLRRRPPTTPHHAPEGRRDVATGEAKRNPWK